MGVDIKKKKRRAKPILCLAVVIILLAGCTQNDGGKKQKSFDMSAVSSKTGTQTSDVAAVEPTEAKASGGTAKQVALPDIRRKARNIENKYGIYYEIFVRSFADSDQDGIGDLKGLTSRLDYLNDNDPATYTDLGVNGIYLMPVNVSPSYHKYDVVDYYDIDPEYGTMGDFTTFLAEAHKRGIKVLMDLVINHTSSKNPWFIESAKFLDNPFRDYYHWAGKDRDSYVLNGTSSWGSQVWHPLNNDFYYGIFWDQMPDLNYDNPKVREEVKKVAKYWLEKGVDGFRLDAALHIYGAYESSKGENPTTKNLQWWSEFGAAAEEVNPDVYLVGEVWDNTIDISPYFKGLDSLFNFEVGEAVINIVNAGTGKAAGDKGFTPWLEEKYRKYAETEPNFLDAPFLSNHDENRSMDRFDGELTKAKLAAAIYLTLPGNPYIYYGEEIGMKGSKPDERIREPFLWSGSQKPPQTYWESNENNVDTVPEAAQQKDPSSLLNLYKKLIRLRQSNEALMKGDFKALDTGGGAVLAYSRSIADGGSVKESVVVLHNLDTEKQSVTLGPDVLSGAEIIFESGDKGINKINGSSIVVSPETTVILHKSETDIKR